MSDYITLALLIGLWLCSVVGAFSAGFCKGWDECNHNHRWNRWLLRREEQRNIRL